MSLLATRPGLHVDHQEPPFLKEAREAGFEWILVQMQNGRDPLQRRDLTKAKTLGFTAGAWGVSYADSRSLSLEDDARRLRQVAIDSGSQIVGMNVEHPFDPAPLIEVFQSWTKPKCVIVTLGIMQEIHARDLVAAGWDVLGEDYLNDQSNLSPAEAEWQAFNAGIPNDRLGHMLGVYSGKLGRFSASRYVAALKDVDARGAFSLWMLEQLDPLNAADELKVYGEYIKSLTTTPPAPDPLEQLMDKLNLANTGINVALGNVEKVFDAAGIPEPDGVDALKTHLLALGVKVNELVDEVNALAGSR